MARDTSALEKALAIMDCVVAADRSPTAAEIAERLGLSRQTAHRVAAQLEDLGLLAREPGSQRFAPGARLRALGAAALSRGIEAQLSRAVLAGLVAELRETCNLGVLDGAEVVYIDRVECDWPLRVQLSVGSRVPAHCTAIGKLLLAHLPAERRRRFLAAAPLPRFTDNTLTDPAALEQHLQRIAAQGFSVNDQEDSVGLVAIAVPVLDAQGAVAAGLAMHAPIARTPLDSALAKLPLLKRAAERIGRAAFGQTEKMGQSVA